MDQRSYLGIVEPIYMKVLITTPDFDNTPAGGVVTYHAKLRAFYSNWARYFYVGRRSTDLGSLRQSLRLIHDYRRFLSAQETGDHDVVFINPSLDRKACLRDAVFILLAKLKGKRLVVFIHGWDIGFEKQIERFGMLPFRFVYDRSDAIVVLANEFRDKLRDWGLKTPIFVESTAVDDAACVQPCREADESATTASANCRILFLSRLVKAKGIFQAIEAFRLLQNERPGVTLVIAGDGPELVPAKVFVEQYGISGIEFPGYVSGKEKLKTYADADIFFLPTEHGEGMPNVILEAMGGGLPVVTRFVGGTRDFFENGAMGFATESVEPGVFVEFLKELVDDAALRMKIGKYNNTFARQYFPASKVAARVQSICLSVTDNEAINIPSAWYEHEQ